MSILSTQSGSADELTWVDLGPILEKLKEPLASKEVVLVGGQALNFWHTRYAWLGHPEFRDDPPLTSKDLDFCGDQAAVRTFALNLGGKALFPPPFDPSPSTGLVEFVDSKNRKRQIDFIERPLGIDPVALRAMALRVDVLSDEGNPTGIQLWVMHPIHCMFSRAYNTMTLPEYQTEHGKLQMRLSVACSRAFLIELLDVGAGDTVTDLAEKVFHFCHDTNVGRRVKHDHGVDPFDSVPGEHPQLPEMFRTLRYPQMVAWIAERRKRALSDNESSDKT